MSVLIEKNCNLNKPFFPDIHHAIQYLEHIRIAMFVFRDKKIQQDLLNFDEILPKQKDNEVVRCELKQKYFNTVKCVTNTISRTKFVSWVKRLK